MDFGRRAGKGSSRRRIFIQPRWPCLENLRTIQAAISTHEFMESRSGSRANFISKLEELSKA